MKTVKLLLDLCHEKCGSDAEVARRLGVPRSTIAEHRSGARPVSAETAAALADILELPGEEAREWVAVAIIENPKNEAKRSMLERALFACWVLGAVFPCMLFIGAPGTAWSAAPRTETRVTNALGDYQSVTDTIFIVARRLRRRLARLLTWMAHSIPRATAPA